MKIAQLTIIAALVLTSVQNAKTQSARDYFKELYEAGGLDKQANEYVCFDDRVDLKAFFIYADYSTLKQSLVANGEFSKLSKDKRDVLNKGFLLVREYDRGVPHREADVYYRDGNTWVTDPFTIHSQKPQMRMRLSIAEATSRYQRKVEILSADLKVKDEVFAYGRCEVIPNTVEQTGP